MKNLLLLIFCVFTVFASCASCKKDNVGKADANNVTANPAPNGSKMKITIGNRSFTVTLYDSPAAIAFKAMLPLTIDMTELNGNEKFFDLPRTLPANAVNPGTIHNGDLMLYGSSTVVLFYKEFSTSYSYTKLGRINNPDGLASALGSGNVRVIYELE